MSEPPRPPCAATAGAIGTELTTLQRTGIVSPEHRHLRRLDHAWTTNPIYFVSMCCHDRRAILATPAASQILLSEWRDAWERHGWLVGRYVILPDHAHFFCVEATRCAVSGPGDANERPASPRPATTTGGCDVASERPASPRPATAETLSRFMERWKEWTAKRLARDLGVTAPGWQAGVFDHLLRSDESYAEKWLYVRENPVRAGLVARAEDWPYQGCIHYDVF